MTSRTYNICGRGTEEVVCLEMVMDLNMDLLKTKKNGEGYKYHFLYTRVMAAEKRGNIITI